MISGHTTYFDHSLCSWVIGAGKIEKYIFCDQAHENVSSVTMVKITMGRPGLHPWPH